MTGNSVAYASGDKLKISPQKLSLVASLIREKPLHDAILCLRFSNKKGAEMIRKVLLSAIANAQNNFGVDIDELFVQEVFVGKAMLLKRIRPRARGRANRVFKRYSNVKVILSVIRG